MTENVHSVPAAEAAMPAPVRESDNPVMKGLLFLRSSAAAAPSLTRGLWQCYGRERAAAARNFLGQYRPHPALYLTLALAVFGAVTFAQTHSLATGVVVNGEYVGAVENRDVFQSAKAFVQTSASDALGYEYDFENESLRTRPAIVANEDLLTEDALVSEICQANNIVSYSYVLEVNGRAVGVGASEDEIKDALRARLTQYSNENTISAEFTAPVSVTREIISDAQGRSLSTVDEAVNATSQEEVIYTIQAGDTWSEIAARYDMSSSDLLALNPGFDMDKIWEGQELTVSGMGGSDERVAVGTQVHIQWDPACSAIVERREPGEKA